MKPQLIDMKESIIMGISIYSALGLITVLSLLAVGLRFVSIYFVGVFWGIIIANALACFVLGLLMHLRSIDLGMNPFIFVAIALAFCGALSTFSSYIELIYILMSETAYNRAALFIILNHLVCGLLFYLGLQLKPYS